MNKEEMRKAFEDEMRGFGFIDMHYTRAGGGSDAEGYSNQYVHYAWQAYQAAIESRQPEIEQLKEDNERLFNVIKQAQVLAGGSERDNAHDMDQQLCEIWLLCDECEQGEK